MAQRPLEELLIRKVGSLLAVDHVTVDPTVALASLGLDSLKLTGLAAELTAELGRPISPVIFWSQPTLAALALALENPAAPSPPVAASGRHPVVTREPIAIIGAACRLPGADSPVELWNLLAEGRDMVGTVPEQRWPGSAWENPRFDAPGSMLTRRGAFLDTIDEFDPGFFVISPREAREMDPQQRLMLELTWECAERAGIAPSALQWTDTGVFTGVIQNDYFALRRRAGLASFNQYTAQGSSLSIVANRVSYALGLRGPSVSIDTACSSSAVAVHWAAESLLRGECDYAFAGGVQLLAAPDSSVMITKFGALSPNGTCYTFDERANGFVRGEGGVVFLLAPLSRAVREGRRIIALLRGGAVNNDGASNGLTAPNPEAQVEVLRRAYARADVAPASVQYVEAHGTGTKLGDPIEANALGVVLGNAEGRVNPLRIGSVKTNFGHLEGAAGALGLLKVLLAFEHRQLPKSLHYRSPNPHIDFPGQNLEVQQERSAWPSDQLCVRAGVSSFGFGGTNAHLVAESAHVLRIANPPVLGARPPARPRVVFCFPGQGGQWLGMARHLVTAEPAFREVFLRCAAVVQELQGWSPIAELFATESTSRLSRVDVVQPLLMSVQIAYAQLWRERGVVPDMVIGHSLGELSAAAVAGILSPEDATRLMCVLSSSFGPLCGRGGMAVVGLGDEAAAARLLPGLDLAATGSAGSCVVSGESRALAAFIASLQAEGIFAAYIEVDFAAHSAQMEELSADLHVGIDQAFAEIEPTAGTIPMISTVLGRQLSVEDCTSGYWARMPRVPVLFRQAVAAALALGPTLFVEMGPHQVLARVLAQADGDTWREVVGSGTRGYDDLSAFERAYSAVAEMLGAPLREPGPQVLALSARDQNALADMRTSWATRLAAADAAEWTRLCRTAASGRAEFRERVALVASSPVEAARLLGAAEPLAKSTLVVGSARPGLRVGFLYSGQGSQYARMGRDLRSCFAEFGRVWARCAEVYRALTGSTLEAAEQALEQSGDSTEYVQPLMFALQVSLTALLAELGVRPELVCGHSVGELAAAVAAGAMDLSDGMRVATERGRLMARACARGRLLAVRGSLADMRALLAEFPSAGVAAYNGPGDHVVACAVEESEAVLRHAAASGLEASVLRVSHAFHSRSLDPVLDELRELAATVSYRMPRVAWISTLTAERIEQAPDADYWVRQARNPVRFGDALARAWGDVDAWVEVGPHGTLLPLLTSLSHEQATNDAHPRGTHGATLRRQRDERACLLACVATLWAQGAPVALDKLTVPSEPLDAPTYPFQRQRIWLDVALEPAPQTAVSHPLFGREHALPGPDRHFSLTLSAGSLPFLQDHVVYGDLVAPGAYSLAAFLLLAHHALGRACPLLSEIQWLRPLRVSTRAQELFFSARPAADGSVGLSLSIRDGSEFVEYARAELAPPQTVQGSARSLERAAPAAGTRVSSDAVYETLARAGVELGQSFRWIESLETGPEWAVAVMRQADPEDERHGLSPTLLDACFQVPAAALLGRLSADEAWLPLTVERIRYTPTQRAVRRCIARFRGAVAGARREGYQADLEAYDEAGNVVVEVSGLTFVRAPANALGRSSGLALRPVFELRARARVQSPGTSPDADASPLAAAVRHVHWVGDSPLPGLDSALAALGVGLSIHPRADLDELGLARQGEVCEALLRQAGTALVVAAPAVGGASVAARAEWVAALTRALESRSAASPIVLLTTGFQEGSEFAGALFGCMRALTAERRRLNLRMIDLPESGGVSVVELAEELMHPADELCVRLGTAGRGVMRLRRTESPSAATPALAKDGVYLITGGAGGLGPHLSRWLVERGARTLVIASRRASQAADADWAVGLRQQGISLTFIDADLAKPGAARSLVAECRSRGAIRGVVHAAGVTRDALLEEQTRAHFEEVFSAKVRAAYELDEVLGDEALDLFVLCSSIAVWIGSAGQVNYAAANGALDQLARARKARGLCGVSLQWGPWADGGMAQRVGEVTWRRWSALGLGTLAAGEASRALDAAVLSGEAVVSVASIDLRRLSSEGNAALRAALDRKQDEPRSVPMSKAASAPQHEDLALMSPAALRTWLGARLGHMVGAALGYGASTAVPGMVPLRELGVDSLTAVDIRGQIMSLIGLAISPTLLFDYPTLDALTEYLVGALSSARLQASTEPPARLAEETGLESELASLDGSELAALMDATLAELSEGGSL